MSTQIKTSAPSPVEGGRVTAPKSAPKEASSAAHDALYRADIAPMKRVELSVDPRQMAEKLKQVLAEANQQMANSRVALGFSMNEAINGPVITVKNLQTTTGKLAESSGRFDTLLKSGQETMDSAKKASDEFRALAQQAQTGRGALGMLISNREMADNLRAFILNLRKHGILWYKDTQKPAQGDEP